MTIAKKYDVPKKLFDGGKIVPGLGVFVLVLLFPALYTCAAGGTKVKPTLELPAVAKDCPPGEICGCVEDVAYMRSYHMDLLNSWRDTAIRDGERYYVSERWQQPIEMSLSNTCLGCHESKAKFCDRCHTYAGVNPYCFDCHVTPGGE